MDSPADSSTTCVLSFNCVKQPANAGALRRLTPTRAAMVTDPCLQNAAAGLPLSGCKGLSVGAFLAEVPLTP